MKAFLFGSAGLWMGEGRTGWSEVACPVMAQAEVGASAAHESRLLVRLEDAAAELTRTERAAALAREARDLAVRAALGAGIPGARVAEVAGVSEGLVSRIRSGRRREGT